MLQASSEVEQSAGTRFSRGGGNARTGYAPDRLTLARSRGVLPGPNPERENPMTNSEAPSEVDAATYETKSVQAIRGTEKHSIAKWEKDGWELVTQTPGKLRTGLVFRRPSQRRRGSCSRCSAGCS